MPGIGSISTGSGFRAAAPQGRPVRFILTAGAKNLCFLPDSQVQTFDWLQQQRKDHHRLQVFPTYGHLDIFMGKRAAKDTFPYILSALDGTI